MLEKELRVLHLGPQAIEGDRVSLSIGNLGVCLHGDAPPSKGTLPTGATADGPSIQTLECMGTILLQITILFQKPS